MKKYLGLFLWLFSVLIWAQNDFEQKEMTAGIITIVNGERVPFVLLSWENDKANYTNAVTYLHESLYDGSIQSIVELDKEDAAFTELVLALGGQVKAADPKVGYYSPGYLEGIYLTKQDFIARKPNSSPKLTKKSFGRGDRINDDSDELCYFYDQDDKKLKKVFAVVHNNLLYFNTKSMLDKKNRNKKDVSHGSDYPNSFSRVLMGGDHYLYFESPIHNVLIAGLTGGLSAGLSSAISGTHTTVIPIGHNQAVKPVLWDYKNQEFNIIRSCDDFDKFLWKAKPTAAGLCEKEGYSRETIWTIIEQIK